MKGWFSFYWMVHTLLLLSSYVLGRVIYAQSTISAEVSQSHGGLPPFWSGNCVGVRPYTAASFGLPVPTQREDTRRCKAPLLTACSYTVKGGLQTISKGIDDADADTTAG